MRTESVQEINLYNLLRYYAKKWHIILVLTVAGFLAGLTYTTFIQTPLYKSDATLILVDESNRNTPHDATLINNYIELFKSRRVLQPVITNLNLDIPYNELVASIEASNEKDTEVIKLSVATKSAETSNKVADAAIESFRKQVSTLYEQDNIETVDKASMPQHPYNVHTAMQLGLATAGGFLLAMVILFFMYDFRLTRKSLEDEAIELLKAKEEAATRKNKSLARKAMRSLVRLTVGTPSAAPEATAADTPAGTPAPPPTLPLPPTPPVVPSIDALPPEDETPAAEETTPPPEPSETPSTLQPEEEVQVAPKEETKDTEAN